MQALEGVGFKVYGAVFGGEASREEADSFYKLGREQTSDFGMALGGGKTVDIAKTTADDLEYRHVYHRVD